MPAYSATGPFNNNTTPAVSASFLNALENWILGMDDPNINATSGGAWNCHTVNFQVGSINRIAFGFASITTGGTTITHGLGASPFVFMLPSSNVTVWASSTTTTTTFTAFCSPSNANVWWLAIA